VKFVGYSLQEIIQYMAAADMLGLDYQVTKAVAVKKKYFGSKHYSEVYVLEILQGEEIDDDTSEDIQEG
jgi:hypothetical protein